MSVGSVLLLGAQGFLGEAVRSGLHAADPGVRVFGADIIQKPDRDPVTVLPAAGGYREALQCLIDAEKPAVVVNCAGYVGNDKCQANRLNIDLVTTVIDAIAHSLAKPYLIHMGSAAEYGYTEKDLPVSENTVPKPVSVYGDSKLIGTRAVIDACRKGRICGSVFRVFNPLGVGMSAQTLVGKICDWNTQKHGEVLRLGFLETWRDYFDARDLGTAVFAVSSHREALNAEVVNVASGEATRTRDVVDCLCDLLAVVYKENDPIAGGTDRSQAVLWQCADIGKMDRLAYWKPRYHWKGAIGLASQ